MRTTTRLAAIAIVQLVSFGSIEAQTCRLSTVTGGSSTVTNVSGYETAGTALSNSDTVDSTYYQVTNALGLGPGALVRTMYSNWVQTNADNSLCVNCDPSSGPHPVFYGSTFVNPTNASITVTQVDVTTNVDHFTPTTVSSVSPLSGWALFSRRLVRWTGSVVVGSRSAQDFVFGDSPQNNAVANTTRQAQLNVTVTTSAGTFTAAPFTETALTSTTATSNAAVTLDIIGGAIPSPMLYIPARSSAAPINIGVRVGETGNNGTNSQIATGLQLTVTIPPRWSSVSVPTIAAPWNAATLSITQPTPSAAGQIKISTNLPINPGANTAANSLVIRASAPISSVANLFPFRLSLSGLSRGGRTISSFNDSVVQVLGNGTQAVNSQFLSSQIGPGPVRQIAFSSAFNVTDGPGGESVTVNVWNNNTSAWDLIQTVTPGSSNATVSRTFTTDFVPYLEASNRMKIQFLSNGTTVRTLRIDQIKWSMTLGYTVNSSTGNDTNVGDVARPFRSLARANSAVAGGGAVYVEVGTSQSGTAYDSNIQINKAGASGCPTLFQGVASGGLLPRVRGITPTDSLGNPVDFGFDIAANYIQVDGFQVENTGMALTVEPNLTGATLSNNIVQLVNSGYGITTNPSTGTTVIGNRIDGTGTSPLFAIVDGGSPSGLVIDGNRTINVGTAFAGIALFNSVSPVVQRNICSGQQYGIFVFQTTGTANLYNNTVDNTVLAGIESEAAGSIVSRNNILTNNEFGIRSNTPGNVSSDYDDAYGNRTSNYVGVTAGAHNISANPLFVQTTDPTLSTYYRLNGGSPCIDRGINVGLPFLGAAPDIGGVESQ